MHGVRVGYTQEGVAKTIEADFCFCAMPLMTLRKIQHDLSAPYRKVVDECTYDGYYKVAWESRRFWEQDYNIYGGLEFVNTGCNPVWLPPGICLASVACWSQAMTRRPARHLES
jgi:monoamine oxidase